MSARLNDCLQNGTDTPCGSSKWALAVQNSWGLGLGVGSHNIPHPPKEVEVMVLDVHCDEDQRNAVYVCVCVCVYTHRSTTSYVVRYFLATIVIVRK